MPVKRDGLYLHGNVSPSFYHYQVIHSLSSVCRMFCLQDVLPAGRLVRKTFSCTMFCCKTFICRMFCPGGFFVFRTFCPWDVFSVERFVAKDMLSFRTVCPALKGQCHEIFDLYIFSLIEPIWAPDKQAKMVFLKDSFLRRYSNFLTS